MKKIVSLLLTLVMSVTLLTACGDPLYDDFENFLNVEMTDVNANYKKITEEAGRWENFEEDAELETSLNEVLLPLTEDSLEKLGKITPATEEVTAVKDKYVAMMEAYKAGFGELLSGLQGADEEKVLAGNEKIETAVALLEEYNAALEDLASEVGASIEY